MERKSHRTNGNFTMLGSTGESEVKFGHRFPSFRLRRLMMIQLIIPNFELIFFLQISSTSSPAAIHWSATATWVEIVLKSLFFNETFHFSPLVSYSSMFCGLMKIASSFPSSRPCSSPQGEEVKLTDTATALCNNLIEWNVNFADAIPTHLLFAGNVDELHTREFLSLCSQFHNLFFTANLILAEWIACETVHTAAEHSSNCCVKMNSRVPLDLILCMLSFFVLFALLFFTLYNWRHSSHRRRRRLFRFFLSSSGCRVFYLCVTGMKSSCRIHHCLVSRTQHPHLLVLAHNHHIKRTEAIHEMPISCLWNIQLRWHALAHNTNFHHHNYFFIRQQFPFFCRLLVFHFFISARLSVDAFSLWWIFDYETRLGKSIRLKCFIRSPQQQQLAESQ